MNTNTDTSEDWWEVEGGSPLYLCEGCGKLVSLTHECLPTTRPNNKTVIE